MFRSDVNQDYGLRTLKEKAYERSGRCRVGSEAYRAHINIFFAIQPKTTQTEIVQEVRKLHVSPVVRKAAKEIYGRYLSELEKIIGPAINGVK